MKHTTFALFADSKKAGDAVSELKQMGYTQDISLVAQRENEDEPDVHQIKEETGDGIGVGAVVGGTMGVLAGIIAGLSAVVIPGVGPLIIGGPLAATWGLTGGALGALTGGLVGGLVDAGISEETAKMYQDRIGRGEVLVAVSSEHDKEPDVQAILNKYGADSTALVHVGE